MAEESALRGAGWWRLARELDPFRATWRLFTNVRWAIGITSLGLFDVFHAGWFIYALGLLVVSVAVCTASRLPPIWRSVNRPPKRVNDAYFQSARHRFEYERPAGASRLESVLRRRPYAVERYQGGDNAYLFAE